MANTKKKKKLSNPGMIELYGKPKLRPLVDLLMNLAIKPGPQ